MNPEIKLQLKGLTFVGMLVAAAAVILVFFFKDMTDLSFMGASDKYRPHFPAVPTTDITQAPQCAPGYDKTWIGCQKLNN